MSYAWKMVAVTFFTQFLAMGFTFYSFGYVLKPLAAEFGADRFEVTMLSLAMSLAGGAMAPFIGKWVVNGSIRNIMTLGCVAMGLGFLLAARTTELWQLGIVFGSLLPFAMATMGGVTTQALVVNWFEEDRTMALGVSLMGISASGVAMAFVTASLIESGGWRWAFEVFGWAALCAVPVVWPTVIGHPDERESPIEASAEVTSRVVEGTGPTSLSTRDALRERSLWIIAIVCGISFMATSAVMTHAVAFVTDIGLHSSQAAWIMAMLAAGAAAGKIFSGWLAGRIGEQGALYVALGMEGLGILILTLDTPFAVLLAVSVVLGMGIGGVMPLGAALLARTFGPRAFGPMMGLMTPIMIPFQSVGAPLAASVYDSTGSYHGAWFAFVAFLLLACGLLALLRLDAPQHNDPSIPLERNPARTASTAPADDAIRS